MSLLTVNFFCRLEKNRRQMNRMKVGRRFYHQCPHQCDLLGRKKEVDLEEDDGWRTPLGPRTRKEKWKPNTTQSPKTEQGPEECNHEEVLG